MGSYGSYLAHEVDSLTADRDTWRARAEQAEQDCERLSNDLAHAEEVARREARRAADLENERDALAPSAKLADPGEPSAKLVELMRKAKADERRRVVAWLRDRGTWAADVFADRIEAGAHEGEL